MDNGFLAKLIILIYLELSVLSGLLVKWGKAIWSEYGLTGAVIFLLFAAVFAYLFVKRDKLISAVVREFKHSNQQELKSKIAQLEAKRGIISSIIYLIKEMGLGREKVPKASSSMELADLGPNWIKKYLAEMMYKYERLAPIFINSFLPPVKASVYSSVKKEGVFMGASVGSGMGLFEQKIAKWCDKNNFPAVIFATDCNKTVLLESQKIMAKKGVQTAFWDEKEKIDLEKLASSAKDQKKCLVYFLPLAAEKFDEVFSPEKRIDLVWFLNSREHAIEGKPGVFNKIRGCSKEWAILELLRDWKFILVNLAAWWLSPIFAAETEISISRNLTLKEWINKNIEGKAVIIKRFCTAWIVSKGVYEAIKENPSKIHMEKLIAVSS